MQKIKGDQMQRTLSILILLMSSGAYACDVFSVYAPEKEEINIYLSGDPAYCRHEEEEKAYIASIIQMCYEIDDVKSYYDISEKQAIVACQKLKEKQKR